MLKIIQILCQGEVLFSIKVSQSINVTRQFIVFCNLKNVKLFINSYILRRYCWNTLVLIKHPYTYNQYIFKVFSYRLIQSSAQALCLFHDNVRPSYVYIFLSFRSMGTNLTGFYIRSYRTYILTLWYIYFIGDFSMTFITLIFNEPG